MIGGEGREMKGGKGEQKREVNGHIMWVGGREGR